MDDPDRLTRRKVLAAVTASALPSLTGCSRIPPDHTLDISVRSIRRTDRGVEVDVRVRHTQEDASTPSESAFIYRNTQLLLYGRDRSRLARVNIGDLPQGSRWDGTVVTDEFPLVITANSSSIDTSDATDVEGTRGIGVYGYQRRPEPRAEDASRFDWLHQYDRRLDESPRPPQRLVDSLVCNLRSTLATDGRSGPDSSLFPEADEWLTEPFGTTMWTFHRFEVEELTLENDASLYDGLGRVPFEQAPNPIRERIAGIRYDQLIDPKTFYQGVRELSGGSFTTYEDFQNCQSQQLDCQFARTASCSDENLEIRGHRTRCLQYFVSYEDSLWSVRPCHERRWASDERSQTASICMQERTESFSIRLHNVQDDRPEGLTAVAVPEEARELMREVEANEEQLVEKELSRERWMSHVQVLTGTDESTLPTCEPSFVECQVDRSVRCGTGERRVHIGAQIDDDWWEIRLTYQWDRKTLEETAESEI